LWNTSLATLKAHMHYINVQPHFHIVIYSLRRRGAGLAGARGAAGWRRRQLVQLALGAARCWRSPALAAMPGAAAPAVGAWAKPSRRWTGATTAPAAPAPTTALNDDDEPPLRCLAAMPPAWYCDCSKVTGFRCGLTPRQAVRTALSPRHNECCNVLTDLLPLLFFLTAAVHTMLTSPGYAAAPAWLRHSFLLTSTFTVVQHALSCVAHVFNAVSARLSHTVWLLDYAGIALINAHNAPAIVFVGWPELGEPLWPWWLAVNVVTTVLLLGWAVYLTLTYQPPAKVRPRRRKWPRMRAHARLPDSSMHINTSFVCAASNK
jgi:hypothetical protein